MFHDIAEPRVRVGSRKAYVVPVSIAAHVVVAALAFILPILAPGLVPDVAQGAGAYFIPVDIELPAPPPPPPVRPRSPDAAPQVPKDNPNAAPVKAPDRIEPEPEEPIAELQPPADDGRGLVQGCLECGRVAADDAAPPPPPPAPDPETPRRIGGDIRPPTKVKDVTPVYPAIALATRTQGIVIIEATLDVNGRVVDARVLRSIPLLDAAAVEAVRQWEYTPTRLNGVPVPVVMTVTVNFALR
ncbi:MAG: energy transducer TonB [Vicinamibacterales bacterium]